MYNRKIEFFWIVLTLGFCLGCCARPETKTVVQTDYRVFFTPSRDCEKNIIAEMKKSEKTIDIAIYAITNTAIANAILAAHNRGVQVRIVTDSRQSKSKNSLISKLSDAGIPIVKNHRHKIEHNKFAVFDGKHVVSGSYNWTTNASKYNSENCVFFDQPDKEYSTRFEYLWKMYHKK